eukprot:4011143-Prymnesium_polylepis.1
MISLPTRVASRSGIIASPSSNVVLDRRGCARVSGAAPRAAAPASALTAASAAPPAAAAAAPRRRPARTQHSCSCGPDGSSACSPRLLPCKGSCARTDLCNCTSRRDAVSRASRRCLLVAACAALVL